MLSLPVRTRFSALSKLAYNDVCYQTLINLLANVLSAMRTIIVDVFIPADEYIKRYIGNGAIVHTTSRDGRSVQFPANILQPFVTHSGVRGSFCISFDHAGKFSSIKKL